MASLDHEVFGQIKFRRDEGWFGETRLPTFATCRDIEFDKHFEQTGDSPEGESVRDMRERKRHAKRIQDLAEARFPMLIIDPDQEGPTEAQQKAYTHLLEHEAEVCDAVLQYILRAYCDRGYWTLEGFVQDSFGPIVESISDLKKCLRLESVSLEGDEEDESVPITLRFSSPLDEEHGIEVTTIGTKVDDLFEDSEALNPLTGRQLVTYPFELPESVDASAIEPTVDGHRFVELQYGGRWSGIFVLDPSMRCVGTVANSLPKPLPDVSDINGVRALSQWTSWRSSLRTQQQVSMSTEIVNWCIALPCLVCAWLYEPRLFWACIALGLAAHVMYYLFQRLTDQIFGLATFNIVLSIVGLIYASRVSNFGSAEHLETTTGTFGWVLWWGTCGIAIFAGLILCVATISLGAESFRDGLSTLLIAAPGIFLVAVLVMALIATSYWQWPAIHLLWITPGTLIASFGVFFLSLLFMPLTAPEDTPCPHCGSPLASSEAQQCLDCGADWHEKAESE